MFINSTGLNVHYFINVEVKKQRNEIRVSGQSDKKDHLSRRPQFYGASIIPSHGSLYYMRQEVQKRQISKCNY